MSQRSKHEGAYIGRIALTSVLLLATATATNAVAFTSSSSSEVSLKFKARNVGDVQLGAYKDELIDCSALAGIHTWIGDNLNTAGAEVRKALNGDYWVSVSNAYLSLAQQAANNPEVSKEVGARMRVLAAEYRELTESPAGTTDWSGWYDLIDRCDSWRTDSPSQAFFTNGRESPVQVRQSTEIARAPF
jgi:hypothetical protein